jgi:poly(A) polymerase
MTRVAEALDTLQNLASSEPVKSLAEAFDQAGYELALVGGPVRDAFLGRAVNDLDFTTSATPDQIEKLVAPLADATWDVGRAFGTIAAKFGEHTIEITTYRADSYDGQSRKPTVEFGNNLDDDLVRRDFTVNAMAVRVPGVVLVDPHGGLTDLTEGILRTPSSPEVSFADDPLRMMRACRFVAQLGMSLEAETAGALQSMVGKIQDISAERVREELVRTLSLDDPRAGVEVFVDSGLAAEVLPELALLREERDEHNRHKDVYQHSLTVLEQAIDLEKERFPEQSPDITLRVAALLHDIGKPVTKKFESGGQVTFHHHDVVGAKMAKKRLTALRFDNDTIDKVSRLIELHLRFFGYADQGWSDSAVRRYVRDAGDVLERLHILTRADVTTRNRQKADRLAFAYDDLEQRIDELSEQEELNAMRPDLDGEQIMDILGIGPSKTVGQAYRFLLDQRIENGPLGEEAAKEKLLQWWAEQS